MVTALSRQLGAMGGLLFITLIWGTTFILVKWTVAEIDVYYFLFLRFLTATAFLALIFHRHLQKTTHSTIVAAFVLSLFLFVSYAAQTEGLRFTTASNSALITGLYLVLVPLISMIFLRKRPDSLPAIGAITALGGLYLLTQYSFFGFNFGDGITLICALTYAFHIILTDKFTKAHTLIPLVLFQFVFVTLYSGIIAGARMSFTAYIPPVALITIAVTGIFATAFAFTIQTAAQRIIDPTRTGIIFAMEAVFGALFAYLIGGEMLTMLSFVGACLMVSGMLIAEIKPIAKYLFKPQSGVEGEAPCGFAAGGGDASP